MTSKDKVRMSQSTAPDVCNERPGRCVHRQNLPESHLHSHADPINIASDVDSLCVSFRDAPGLKQRNARQRPSAKLSGSMS